MNEQTDRAAQAREAARNLEARGRVESRERDHAAKLAKQAHKKGAASMGVKVSDAQLLEARAHGMGDAEIAARFEITETMARVRIRRASKRTKAARAVRRALPDT